VIKDKEAANRGARESQALVARIRPLLAGRSPEIQGAVLCDLLALWLAGHYRMGDEMIETQLQLWLGCVRKLVPVNVAILKKQTEQ
jgi:hypothetical protein